MNGSNVNRKFFQKTLAKSMNENYHPLIDISSCFFHIVEGAFRTGAEKAKWALKKLSYSYLHKCYKSKRSTSPIEKMMIKS